MTVKATRGTTLEAAREYVARGWRIVPIPTGKKSPVISGWPKLCLAEQDLQLHFGADGNIGVILGEQSGGLVDVDLDDPTARDIAATLLPFTECVHGRPGNPKSHYWYFSNGSTTRQVFAGRKRDITETTFVELRTGDQAHGHQTLVPPSIHPNGDRLYWERNGEPANVEFDVLSHAISKVAAAAILAVNWPSRGFRNEAANALAGMLLRAGWTDSEAELFVSVVAEAAKDEEFQQRVRDVVSTANRLGLGRTATGAPVLARLLGNDVVDRVRQWLKLDIVAPPIFTLPSPTDLAWPESLAPEAFDSLAGQIVRTIEPCSEADPAALLLQLLVALET